MTTLPPTLVGVLHGDAPAINHDRAQLGALGSLGRDAGRAIVGVLRGPGCAACGFVGSRLRFNDAAHAWEDRPCAACGAPGVPSAATLEEAEALLGRGSEVLEEIQRDPRTALPSEKPVNECAAYGDTPLDTPWSPAMLAAIDKIGAPAPTDPLYWVNHALANLRAYDPGDGVGSCDVPALVLILDDARKEIVRLRALIPAEQVKEKTLMTWHDKPSCEGPWWFTTPDCRTPALVYVGDMYLDDGKLRFSAEHFGTEDRSHEGDFAGARWTPCLTPASAPAGEQVKRDPDPTVPGAHGERVERRG